MNPKLKKLLFIVSGISFCLVLAYFYLAKPQSSEANIVEIPDTTLVEETNNYSINQDEQGVCIHIGSDSLQPPVEFYILDPMNHRFGFDPVVNQEYHEISRATYDETGIDDCETGEPGPRTKELMLGDASGGSYTIRVVGIEDGTYTIEVSTWWSHKSDLYKIEDRNISEGEIHNIQFDLVKGEGIKNVRYME